MAMTKAVSYLRVSGLGQVEGDGITRQREAVAKFAARMGYNLVAEYRDEGVSGTNELEDRPGLGELVDRIESNGVRVVLVESATRLARDLLVGEVILARFRKAGVKVVECDGGSDLTVGDENPTQKLIRQILGAVAEFDRAMTVARMRGARVRIRRSTGKCEGRKAFGERDDEAAVIERIRQLRRKPVKGTRLSFAGIAAKLNAEGVPTRTGSPWRPSTVAGILARD
jgi:DNA invertase Pin-like site-specific DNA recombinase